MKEKELKPFVEVFDTIVLKLHGIMSAFAWKVHSIVGIGLAFIDILMCRVLFSVTIIYSEEYGLEWSRKGLSETSN